MIYYESYYGVAPIDIDPIVHHGIKGQKWGVHVDNVGSIKIAERNGFVIDKNSYSSDGQWVNYIRKIHTKKKGAKNGR